MSGIIDSHCHVASERYTPRSFIDASLGNLEAMMEAAGHSVSHAHLLEKALERLQDHNADDLIERMDRAGIERTVLLCPDFSFALSDATLTAEEALLEHRAILERHPGRFYALAGVDPRWGQDGVDLFERAVDDWGFHGLKLYPPCGYSPSDPLLFPYYEICAQKGLPVTLHTGPTSPALSFSFAHPALVDDAARRFPTVVFVLAHAPVAHTEDSLALATFRPNVYMDLSGFQMRMHQPTESSPLGWLLRQGVLHKMMFGTDWPVFEQQATLEDATKAFMDDEGPTSELSDSQLQLVLRGNALRVFGASTTGETPIQ